MVAMLGVFSTDTTSWRWVGTSHLIYINTRHLWLVNSVNVCWSCMCWLNVGTDSEGGEQEAEGAIRTQAEGDHRREPQPPQRAHALSRYCHEMNDLSEVLFGKVQATKEPFFLPRWTQKLLSENVIPIFCFLHKDDQFPFSPHLQGHRSSTPSFIKGLMRGTLTSGGCLEQGSTLQRTPLKATSMCTASEEGQAAPHIKTAPVTSVTGTYTSDSSPLRS